MCAEEAPANRSASPTEVGAQFCPAGLGFAESGLTASKTYTTGQNWIPTSVGKSGVGGIWRRVGALGFAAAIASLIATPAFAHPGRPGGAAEGLLHPFTGLDHMLAMLAVGLWAGLVLGRRAWIWPACFTLCMLAGFAFAVLGGGLPASELLIAASVITLGLAVAGRVRAPVAIGCALTALFAFAHGYAHGVEAPGGASTWAFAGGFALATIGLHLAGLGLAALAHRVQRPALARAAGLAVAGAGLLMLATG